MFLNEFFYIINAILWQDHLHLLDIPFTWIVIVFVDQSNFKVNCKRWNKILINQSRKELKDVALGEIFFISV